MNQDEYRMNGGVAERRASIWYTSIFAWANPDGPSRWITYKNWDEAARTHNDCTKPGLDALEFLT